MVQKHSKQAFLFPIVSSCRARFPCISPGLYHQTRQILFTARSLSFSRGVRAKAAAPGSSSVRLHVVIFVVKCVLQNVNMLKMVITCHRRTWWLVVLVRKAVPDKSDTSTQPVCAFVVCCALSHNGLNIHRLPCGCASNFNVPIRCIWRHIQFPLYWTVERNQTNFVCHRKNVVIFTKTCFIGSIFQFRSLLL